jgi:hypothetical protein
MSRSVLALDNEFPCQFVCVKLFINPISVKVEGALTREYICRLIRQTFTVGSSYDKCGIMNNNPWFKVMYS